MWSPLQIFSLGARDFHSLSRFVQLSMEPVKAYENGPDYDILDPRAEDEVNALADKVAIIYLASFEPPSWKGKRNCRKFDIKLAQ